MRKILILTLILIFSACGNSDPVEKVKFIDGCKYPYVEPTEITYSNAKIKLAITFIKGVRSDRQVGPILLYQTNTQFLFVFTPEIGYEKQVNEIFEKEELSLSTHKENCCGRNISQELQVFYIPNVKDQVTFVTQEFVPKEIGDWIFQLEMGSLHTPKKIIHRFSLKCEEY